jgi:hypothetical protein
VSIADPERQRVFFGLCRGDRRLCQNVLKPDASFLRGKGAAPFVGGADILNNLVEVAGIVATRERNGVGNGSIESGGKFSEMFWVFLF